MSSYQYVPRPIEGARVRKHVLAAVAGAAAIISCVANGAALFADQPARAMSLHEVIAVAAANHESDASNTAPEPKQQKGHQIVADAGDRRTSEADQPLAPCPAPVAPQFDAMPQGPRELGDFPRQPFA